MKGLRMKLRRITKITAAAVATAFVAAIATPGTAAAADSKDVWLLVNYNGETGTRSWVEFNADPGNGDPGDAIRACDRIRDRHSVIAVLQWKVKGKWRHRSMEKRESSGPGCTSWKTGNIREGTKVRLSGCIKPYGNCREKTGYA
ncbi:hypothetical protein GCM10027570_41740 [Streptomonospora sediminis]